MKIRDLFAADVERDIPPVVYFHEQTPAKLHEEVSEYIITGGYPEGDPRARRVKSGIHEEFVHLLTQVRRELDKKGGADLPASWISGFFGSGKSSFAKLLGLALDGVVLPNGTPLSTALLARDDSPKRAELEAAWNALVTPLQPLAVVFDIGGVARDDEHIHSAVLRQVQLRLGYCPTSNLVAETELRLERDEEWPHFLKVAEETLGRSWDEAKEDEQADDHFSDVMHRMNPTRFRDPTSWIDSRAGSRAGTGMSVGEVVASIEAMLAIRAEGKTLFVVVDEVSQYVHQDLDRMLKLQTFVSELGKKLKGGAWLFATGQQKLDEASDKEAIGKLQDRFPAHLRVHLGTTNIRDVVHKRLLRKKPEHEEVLRQLFRKSRSDLKVNAYACDEITEEDFLEVYPMLPGHIDLLMQITTALRTKSSRMRGDDHAIRGLLQLLGELFREQKLADHDVGSLVTLPSIFEVQHSALDADVQTTLNRIFNHVEVRDDALALRVGKAVALLELIQESVPTMPVLVAQCLYDQVGAGNQVKEVTEALDKLKTLGLISYSEKHGYKIQSSAGQEWQRLREDIGVTQEQVSKLVQGALKTLVGSSQERPKWRGRSFPWTLWYSDGRHAIDVRLQDAREEATVAVDFRFLNRKDERESPDWVKKSDQNGLRNRLVWIVGESTAIETHARELVRSERMIERHRAIRESLSREKQRLLNEEEARFEEHEVRLRKAVDEAFRYGTGYFRGRRITVAEQGGSFSVALVRMASDVLPDLYPHFSEIAVTPTELGQLLEKELSGPSTKFLEGGLGILSLDAGKYVATCHGTVPAGILQQIQASNGLSGQALIATFVNPPFGYPADLVKACCAGLVRGKRLRIHPEHGEDITWHQDPGIREVFGRDRDFRRAEFFPAIEGGITQRDRIAIKKLLDTYFQLNLDPEDEAIADATFLQFPGQRERLRDVERRFSQLPGRPPLPDSLVKLGRALEDCCRSRHMEKTVGEVKRNLDTLRDGLEQLGLCQSDLTDDTIQALSLAARIRDNEVQQLRDVEALSGLEAEDQAITSQLKSDRPWKGIHEVQTAITTVRARYVEHRKSLLTKQNAEAEAVLGRIKIRSGFEKLNADAAHRVLRPITEAMVDTSPEAVAPTLAEVRDRFRSRIGRAEETANDRLDEELAKGDAENVVVKVDAGIRGREVQSREQLKAIFSELEERIGPHLDKGVRVRIQ